MSLTSVSGRPGATDRLDQIDTKPDFIILAYGGLSIDDPKLPVSTLPPTFMYGTVEDAGATSLMMKWRAGSWKQVFRLKPTSSGTASMDRVLPLVTRC
jgi:hypothetical protein